MKIDLLTVKTDGTSKVKNALLKSVYYVTEYAIYSLIKVGCDLFSLEDQNGVK
jgi:hypothetical protein